MGATRDRGRAPRTGDLSSVEPVLAAAEKSLRRCGALTPRAQMALNAARWGVAELTDATATSRPGDADAA